ncbi:MAG: hypothetical protein DMG92_18090 [Acidobacteria bacterium]|nr:MAG: hypothetical protein DMG92_18090 [Acidobacteriota bacterium]
MQRPMDIQTERLVLRVSLPDEIEWLLAGESRRLELANGFKYPPDDPNLGIDLEWHLRELRADPTQLPWRIRLIVEHSSNTVIGSINLKGPPDAEGDVEIGWGLNEGYRGQGYATEAAAAAMSHGVSGLLGPRVPAETSRFGKWKHPPVSRAIDSRLLRCQNSEIVSPGAPFLRANEFHFQSQELPPQVEAHFHSVRRSIPQEFRLCPLLLAQEINCSPAHVVWCRARSIDRPRRRVVRGCPARRFGLVRSPESDRRAG